MDNKNTNKLKNKISKDVLLKDFWRDNERFADLFNTIFFQGKKVLDPNSLHEMDTDVSGVIELKDNNQTLSRMRDIIKKTAYGVDFIICGIENQDRIHYAMPLRNMIYDALGYLKEYQEINRSHKNQKNHKEPDKNQTRPTKEEFLSGMRREDRFHPIITIVIYYNEKEWDGPYSLSDMMIELPPDLEEVFSDYKMNLLQVCKSDEYTFSNEDVQTVFEISRNIYKGNFDEIRREYEDRDIKAELALVIGKITDSNYIIEEAMDEEVINMCTALENLRKQGVEEGKIEGKREGIQEGKREGKREGIQEGKLEEKTNIAKVSIKKGLPIDLIVDITGLTIEEIEQLFDNEKSEWNLS